MKKRTFWRVAAMLLTIALITAACGDDDDAVTTTAAPGTTVAAVTTTEAPSADPIVLCELAYYTGPFGPYGASLTAEVVFPFAEVVNQDPPLGREIVMVHEDIGTVGEGQAARTCVEQHGADIMFSPAHEYLGYRDWMLGVVADTGGPLMPTVHGGSIPGNIGGVASEPIFRAQGSDEGQAVMDVAFAESLGITSIVIVTTPTAGYQLAADAAEIAAGIAGIEVLARIDAPGEAATYRTEVQQIIDLNPGAIVIQAQAVESATMIKQAFEAGASLLWLGELGWSETEFVGTATPAAIDGSLGVYYPTFGLDTTTAAYDYYCPIWEGNPDYMQFTEDAGCNDAYAHTTYDLGIMTALAIEAGGSVNAADWAPAMQAVANAPGTLCYTYPECLALIRSGEEIDYYGVTGPESYSAGGVNGVIPAMTPFNSDGTFGDQVLLDADRYLELLEPSTSVYTG
ncbi:amino acid ABC transporter substrate-binding protein [bacterium]|nr:amino acid ABC transporter substrate-binding protein [bacterium]